MSGAGRRALLCGATIDAGVLVTLPPYLPLPCRRPERIRQHQLHYQALLEQQRLMKERASS